MTAFICILGGVHKRSALIYSCGDPNSLEGGPPDTTQLAHVAQSVQRVPVRALRVVSPAHTTLPPSPPAHSTPALVSAENAASHERQSFVDRERDRVCYGFGNVQNKQSTAAKGQTLKGYWGRDGRCRLKVPSRTLQQGDVVGFVGNVDLLCASVSLLAPIKLQPHLYET